VITADFIAEPELEFGYAARHQEQRRGLILHGPADIELSSRPTTLRLGLLGQRRDIGELQEWLERCVGGIPGREDTTLTTLFPSFPGTGEESTFRISLQFSDDGKRELTTRQLRAIKDGSTEAERIRAAADLVAAEVHALLENASVDVVLIARPPGVPDGVAAGSTVGLNFHDLLKAKCISASVPIQVIRARTWRGGVGVEDEASRAWNLMTALYYKCGGKPWRLARPRNHRSRCFVGISFTRGERTNQLHTSVAQVFNELGDGVVVRGGLARRSGKDKQPHLSEKDAGQLLGDALARYREHHGNPPAEITIHKTSAYSTAERRGFLKAVDKAELHSCDLLWITDAEDAFLIRGSSRYPPMRGTLVALDDEVFALYTHGSVPYYKTYPGMYVPRPLGIRPAETDRDIGEIATEILALTKLNWNRARMDARKPITLLTSKRVGEILRHVDKDAKPAARYAFYM
jgi:hypothetical protein